MRDPLSKALWSALLSTFGLGLVLLAHFGHVGIGETTSTVVAIVGMTLAPIFLFTCLWALSAAIGYARLTSGHGVIARWHITAEEWSRFRIADDARAAEHPSLRNDVRIRKSTPLGGVDVIVGYASIIVDGSFHSIAGLSSGGRQVNWLTPPLGPECIEFPKSYPRSRGGSIEFTLRVPVPASARAEGVHVYEAFRAKEKR